MAGKVQYQGVFRAAAVPTTRMLAQVLVYKSSSTWEPVTCWPHMMCGVSVWVAGPSSALGASASRRVHPQPGGRCAQGGCCAQGTHAGEQLALTPGQHIRSIWWHSLLEPMVGSHSTTGALDAYRDL
jgi:hypothetical protein